MKRVFTLLFIFIAAFSLKSGAQSQTCNPDFTFTATNQYVQFMPATTDSITANHKWLFGDGTSSGQGITSHYYMQPGTYVVKHIVQRKTSNGSIVCSDTAMKTIQLSSPCGLQAFFSWQVDQTNSSKYYFTNHSQPLSQGDSIRWTFGDGTSSYDLNAVHTYAQPGTYNVCLRVKKNTTAGPLPCASEYCKTVVVQQATNCNLIANFTWQTSNTNGQAISFTNTSIPSAATDSVWWSFGDGTTGVGSNQVHTYAQPGTYRVCLHVMKSATCHREVCKTITVGATISCNLVANFSYAVDPANSRKINFTNTSAGFAQGDSVKWTFGDGTFSYDLNPSHTYTSAGSYNVCLRVKKAGAPGTVACVKEICKTINVADPGCNLQANFYWIADSNNNRNLHFFNTSSNFAAGDSIRWTFGDGSTSTAVNPTHLYAQNGTYTVCLWIKKPGSSTTAPCVREICRTVVIQTVCNLQPSFYFQVDSTNANKVRFVNTSGGYAAGDSIKWSFGDGTYSYDVNPTHVYTQAGTYNVCLWIKKASASGSALCAKDICKTVVIAAPCTVVANFTYVPDTGRINNIKFTNTSASAPITTASVKWSFGDGTYAYTWNATHLYNQPGTYNVCLRIQTSATCIKEVCKTITVTVPCDKQVKFTTFADQNNPRRIYFNNTTGATAGAIAKWTFGDGTSATGWNAVHEYAAAGRYRVCLSIQFYPGCVKEKCDSITVNATSTCSVIADWKSTKSTTDCLKFKFEPFQKNTSWQYLWKFGDGTVSTAMMPEKRYTHSGTYNVCLTVTKSPSCVATNCHTVTTGNCSPCDSAIVKYTYQRDPTNQYRISFTAVSNSPLSQQTWSITKLPYSSASVPVILQQTNPTYTFSDTGYYRVCLKAQTANGCIKEYCEVIRIGAFANTTCLLNVYPNPTSNDINVNVTLTGPQMIHAYIYNSLNILVREKHQAGTTGNNVVNINVATLVPGIYTIKLVYGNKVCHAQFQKQ